MRKRFRILEPGAVRFRIAAWFRRRIDLGPALALMAKKTVPVHRHSWIYMLGGAALFLFGLQVLTGGLLMLYYQPTEATAHESVQRITSELPFGRIVRSVHAWGADFFIAIAALHLLIKLFTGAYRRPREMTWVSGGFLLFLALAFGFSGYLLPWNELSYYATLVGTQIPGTIPVVGDWVVHLLRGGQHVTGDTLTRFFSAHVFFLPLAFGLFVMVHVALIQAQGMSLPLGMARAKVRDGMPFFSEFLLMESCIWLVLFGTIVTLGTLLPVDVGIKANPLNAPPLGIKPEWYFLFMFQTLKHVPESVGVFLFVSVAVFVLAIPFVDRKAAREKRSRGLTIVCILFLIYAAVFQIVALTAPGAEHGSPEPVSESAVARDAVSLVFLWAVISFLVVYLRQLLKENIRIRRLYAQNEAGTLRGCEKMGLAPGPCGENVE